MRMSRMVAGGALAVALIGCGTLAQDGRTGRPIANRLPSGLCTGLGNVDALVGELYAKHVLGAARTYRSEWRTRGYQHRYLSGARLSLAAAPNVSEAYLERALSCYAARDGADVHPSDPLRAPGVAAVNVSSAGPVLNVAIVGVSRSSAQAIWQRAEALAAPRTQVHVEQLSALPSAVRAF